MQGPVFVAPVVPAAWKLLRTLMPSHSINQGPSLVRWPQLGAGSGKGQNPALAHRDHRAKICGSETALQSRKLAGGG